jgi:hypothetical protein
MHISKKHGKVDLAWMMSRRDSIYALQVVRFGAKLAGKGLVYI